MSTGFPAPPVSKLDFPIYKPRPGTELISIQHKQEASRNQQDSPGTQLLSQKVQYFILFYPEWVKGWVTFLFHCSREEDLAKEAMRSPKAKPFNTQTFASPSFSSPEHQTEQMHLGESLPCLPICLAEHWHFSPFILVDFLPKLKVTSGSEELHPAATGWRQRWDGRDGIFTGLCLTADTCNRLVLGRKVISWHFQIKACSETRLEQLHSSGKV